MVDNAGGHKIPDKQLEEMENVKLYFLPPNLTSHLQPCDAGIIRSFKAHYRKRLVEHLLSSIENTGEIVLPDVKQAIYFIKESWEKVTSLTISNCWRHVGIVKIDIKESIINKAVIDEEYQIVVEDLKKKLDFDKFKYKGNVEDYINIDLRERTCESLTDEEIVSLVRNKAIEEDCLED